MIETEQTAGWNKEIACYFCDNRVANVDAAQAAGWTPSFLDGENGGEEEIDEPVCLSCQEKYFGDNDFVKKMYHYSIVVSVVSDKPIVGKIRPEDLGVIGNEILSNEYAGANIKINGGEVVAEVAARVVNKMEYK
jgi:hypothetical protein